MLTKIKGGIKMKCRNCKTENPCLKKCCMECGLLLSGETTNNVTGEWEYRGEDGLFYKSESEYRKKVMSDSK